METQSDSKNNYPRLQKAKVLTKGDRAFKKKKTERSLAYSMSILLTH